MKTTLILCSAAFALAALPVRAEIVLGPINNPNNGHDYYLLSPNSWTAAEVEAEKLGGTLAIVRNAADERWIYSTFASQGNLNRTLWIGLRRIHLGGPFEWVNGEATNSTYSDWCEGQPDNGSGVEDKVEIWTPREGWNDARDWEQHYGVVEMPQDMRVKAFTKREKSLVGAWFQAGRSDLPCYITRTENRLFIVTFDGRGAMLTAGPAGVIVPRWNMQGQIVEDKILWSDGTWWSRKATSDAAIRIDGESGER